jgi:hypothetical protein
MSNTREANDFLMAEGAKSFPFEKVDDVVVGTVVSATVAQQTDLDTGTPLTWADGSPRRQLIITLQTDLRSGDDDDGVRAIYAKGGKYDVETGEGTSMKDALARAVREGGGNGIEPGDKLAVAHTGLGVRKNRGFNPPKLYTAQWSRPAAAVSAKDLFGDMAEPG